MIKFRRQNILYYDNELGYKIVREDIVVHIPPLLFFDPERYLRMQADRSRVKIIYETYKSEIYEISGDIEKRFYVKIMRPAIDTMYYDTPREELVEVVINRAMNEIFSSTRAQNTRGIRTSAEMILAGIKHHDCDNFYIVMSPYSPGIFLDDFLVTRKHLEMPEEELVRYLLFPFAEMLVKLHGKKDEMGLLHGDLHPGNIYLLERASRDENFNLILADWELSPHDQRERILDMKARRKEFERLSLERPGRTHKAVFPDDLLEKLWKIYLSLI